MKNNLPLSSETPKMFRKIVLSVRQWSWTRWGSIFRELPCTFWKYSIRWRSDPAKWTWVNRKKWRINIITYPRGLRTRRRRAAGAVAWGQSASREGQVPGGPGTYPLAATSPNRHSVRVLWRPASVSSVQTPPHRQMEYAWWGSLSPWQRLPPRE